MEIRYLFFDKNCNMKRLDYGRIIIFSFMIFFGIALCYFKNEVKDYSVIAIAFGLLGFIKFIKNVVLRFVLFILLLCISTITLLIIYNYL